MGYPENSDGAHHTADRAGYYIVNIPHDDGQRRHRTVSNLVAGAFIPNPEGKSEASHKNGDKADNRAENLQWTTHAETQAYGGSMGLMAWGERNAHAKLTVDQVREIRSRRSLARHRTSARVTWSSQPWELPSCASDDSGIFELLAIPIEKPALFE